MATKENNLPVLYGELNKLGQNGEYERAIKIANKSEFLWIYELYIISEIYYQHNLCPIFGK